MARAAPRGMVTLRMAPEAAPGLAATLGLEDPAVRRWTAAGDRTLIWMSPDERLLLCPRWDGAALVEAASAAMAGAPHLAADVSDLRAAFRVEGPGARDALAKGAPMDLSRGAFGPGDVRRTHLGEVAALIRMESAAPDVLEVFCARSVARHLEAWLDAATRPGRAPSVL